MTRLRKKKQPGSITRHYDRHGRLWWRVRLWVRGKRKSLGLYATKAEAKRVLAGALARLGKSLSGWTLSTWGPEFLDRREADGIHRGVHKSRSVFRNHIAKTKFAKWPLHRITSQHVTRWVKSLLRAGYARQTVSNALVLLRVMLQEAVEEGHIRDNPARPVRVPKVPRDDRGWSYFELSEIDELLAAVADSITLTKRQRDKRAEQRAVFTLAIYTGMRAGELWGLRWRDVHATYIEVCRSYKGPTKSGKPRRVPLLPRVRAALAAWRKEKPGVGDALVFPARGRKQKCHAEGYDAGLRRVIERAGLSHRRFHDCRHTCASHLVMGSTGFTRADETPWRLEEVQQWLGHESLTTTERYRHLSPDALVALADGDTKGTPRRKAERE